MIFNFNDNREFYVMGGPTLFGVDLVFSPVSDNFDFNLSIAMLKLLSGINMTRTR